jgi:hypothetical protein
MNSPTPSDPLQLFSKDPWWVKLLALLIQRWSIPLAVLAASVAKLAGWF